MILRDYQQWGVDALFKYWEDGPIDPDKPWGNPLLVYPTGTGKSLIIAGFIKQAIQRHPNVRILVVSHVKELIEQDYEKLIAVMPTAPAGIYSAGLRRKDTTQQVIFCGIGSVAKKANLFGFRNIVIVDEAHTISDAETTQYRKFLADLTFYNPKLKVAGLTATEYRLGQGLLTEPGGIFTDVALDLATKEWFNWFIEQGYLVPLVPPGVALKTDMDISGVGISNTGDFKLNQLQDAVDKEWISRAAIQETIQLSQGRRHWLTFAAGVQHTRHVAQYSNEYGISAVGVHSNSKDFPFTDAERDEAVRDFRNREYDNLVNNGCFTTGFDDPYIDLIFCLRHTTSPGLWVQILGRGTRPVWPCKRGSNWHLWPQGYVASGRYNLETKEGRLLCIAEGPKPNCLVCDYARNTERLGPINDPNKPQSKKKSETPGDAPAKYCSSCLAYNWASARICCQCGAEFKYLVKIEQKVSKIELIAKTVEPPPPVEIIQKWFIVNSMSYSEFLPWNSSRKNSRGSIRSMLRITYNVGDRSFSDTLSLESDGAARLIALKRWKEAGGIGEPETVKDALKLVDKLKKPLRIRVHVNIPNPKILHREYPANT